MVDVGQEHIQGLDPLNAATLNHLPFAGLDATRNDVERNQPLGALLVPIQREGDAGSMEQQVGFATTLVQQLQRCVRQPACELLVMWAATTTRIVHFVKKNSGHIPLLAAKQAAFSYNLSTSIR
ncbi:hypothetical protein D3C85_1047750 [compost metagenome]